MGKQRVVSLVVLVCVMLSPAAALAQQALSGIAGVAKDATGAVLPGVTVEASSPALIEKVRTVVTDGQGQYKIVELRPGNYTLTFTLVGFSTVRREGVELTTAFTATVNAELRVGNLEETVTVSGQAPTVDVHNVVQHQTLSRELLDAVPTNKSIPALAALTPGVVIPATAQDVAGSKGEVSFRMVIHGGRQADQRLLQDGMRFNSSEGTGRTFFINPGTAQEINIELGGNTAESELGGVMINVIPKEGGNRFTGRLVSSYTGRGLQTDNLTDDLRARGLSEVNKIQKVWDFDTAVGGALKKDRLWFFSAHRSWGTTNSVPGVYENKTPDAFVYTPDFSHPALVHYIDRHHGLRLTWQAAKKHKINTSLDLEDNCSCDYLLENGNASPEAVPALHFAPNYIVQATWQFPASNKFLFEAGWTTLNADWPNERKPGVPPDRIGVLEQSTNFQYRAVGSTSAINTYGHKVAGQSNARLSMSYVTGSHAFKTGLFFQFTPGSQHKHYNEIGGDMTYTFLNGAPISLTQFATPITLTERLKANLGLYAQDQWTTKQLTLNVGLRFDYLNSYVPAQSEPAGRFVPARTFAPVYDVPNWKDVSPRLSASYDLFGDGKTALKVNLGGYVASEYLGLARANNPVATSVNQATRTWNDANGNFIPDCNLNNPLANDECGLLSNLSFGQLNITTRYADGVLTGAGHRGYNWQTSASLQRQVMPGVSVNIGYFRTWYRNFTVTDNLSVTPADFDPYCITAPVDSRLPGGGGTQICGLYDVTPTKFGRVNNLVTFASNFGSQTEVFNGVDAFFNAQLPRGTRLSGGWSSGRTVTDACFVVDSPQQLRFCRNSTPVLQQVKLLFEYPLPWDFVTSAVFQNLPGSPVLANYTATSAQISPSLGRPLAQGARGTATIPLVEPNTVYEDRITQLDVRLTKIFKIGGRTRLHGMFDVYNLLNGHAILAEVAAYGSRWLQPTQVLDARVVKFGAKLEF